MKPPGNRRESAYLHDPSASVDPEIAALERALAPLRPTGRALGEAALAAGGGRSGRGRLWGRQRGNRRAPATLLVGAGLLAALAAAAMLAVLLWPAGALRPGSPVRTFVTGADALRIDLGELASLELQPGSELEFVHWLEGSWPKGGHDGRGPTAGQALFRLRRGSVTATVAPPPAVAPGFFVIETPQATVVDQGCRFDLVVDAHGRARVFVHEGAVTFGGPAKQVFVPAGARAIVTAAGVATPTFLETARDVKQLVEKLDALTQGVVDLSRVNDRQRLLDLSRKLAFSCREPRDSLPLYHLLLLASPSVQKVANGALLDLVGPPNGGAPRPYEPEQWLAWLRVSAWQVGG